MKPNEQNFEELSDELFQSFPEEELIAGIRGSITATAVPTVTPNADNHTDADQ